jgi:hypothetical protein
MDTNPCARVTKPRASQEVVCFLSDDERTALLAACKASASPDLYAVVLFAPTGDIRQRRENISKAVTHEWAYYRWAFIG